MSAGPATILIGADLCPIEANRPLFERGNAAALFNDLLAEMKQAGLVIGNLECPLIRQPSPIRKTGPVFGQPEACINGIREAGIGLLCLANNHILDHGAAGLRNTLEVCARAGIGTVGAGDNTAAARRIWVKPINGIRIGVLGVAEHEFSIAKPHAAGANPLDVIDLVRNIGDRRAEFDFLVVLLHGSDEFHVPTPRIQDTCRFLIEMGAGAVVVQHPHVLGGYETWRGGHIVYGQGAWVMDEAIYRRLESFHEGFLVKLTVSAEGKAAMDLLPFIQSFPEPGARRLEARREAAFLEALAERARVVADEQWVREEWIRFCDANKHEYLSALLGHNRWLRRLNLGGLLEKYFHGSQQLLGARNIVTCETHREAITTIFDHQSFS
jgi:poly-gamma-glutamate synthesis protein (capsule biosynthesis protein)